MSGTNFPEVADHEACTHFNGVLIKKPPWVPETATELEVWYLCET